MNYNYQLRDKDSLGGVHDRAWGKRKVFGKIHYMSYNDCKSKFAVAAYIKKYLLLYPHYAYENKIGNQLLPAWRESPL